MDIRAWNREIKLAKDGFDGWAAGVDLGEYYFYHCAAIFKNVYGIILLFKLGFFEQ